jgi:hypothetical protein
MTTGTMTMTIPTLKTMMDEEICLRVVRSLDWLFKTPTNKKLAQRRSLVTSLPRHERKCERLRG